MALFRSDRSRRRAALHLAAALAVAAGAYLLARRYLPFLRTPAAFRAWLLDFGVWAPVVFVAVQAGQVVFAPVPGQVVGFASGYVFGVVHGTLYSMVGTLIGTTVAFVLARHYGRPYVERFVSAEALALFDDAVDRGGQTAVFVSFLLPGLPDDVLCFVAGLTRIRLWKLVAIAFVGRFPSVLLLNLAGAQVADERFVSAGLLVASLAIVTAVVVYRRERILASLDR